MTLKEIYKYVEELKTPVLSKHTMEVNSNFFYNHIEPYFRNRDIRDIKYIDYQQFANDLLSGRFSGRPLKPKTVKNIFNVLSSIYRMAKINGWYDGEDYLSMVELPRFDNRRYFTLDVEYQKAYIRAILDFDEPQYKDIFLLLLHGRRLREALELKWEYLDLNRGLMYLPAKVNKSKKNLCFQLSDKLIELLKLRYQDAIELQNTTMVSGYVFLNPNTNKPYSDLRKPWARLLKKAGLPKIRIHDIRHLVATYSINILELPIEKVSHALGHTDIKTTQLYINPRPENSKEVIDAVFDSVAGIDIANDLELASKLRDLYRHLKL